MRAMTIIVHAVHVSFLLWLTWKALEIGMQAAVLGKRPPERR